MSQVINKASITNSPKVSVIVPVYGVEKYIERCARSLFEQTLDDIEYIFVDDCTYDNSIQILEKISLEYPARIDKIRIIKLTKNVGLPSARRCGVEVADGEFIIHCDSDDWVSNSMLETMYIAAINQDSDAVLCDILITDGVNYNRLINSRPSSNRSELISQMLRGQVHSSLCNKLIKRSLYTNDISFPQSNMREDMVLTIQLISKARNISYINQPFYYYYFNPTSISRSIHKEGVLSRCSQSLINYNIIREYFVRTERMNLYEQDLTNLLFAIKLELGDVYKTKEGRDMWDGILPNITTSNILFQDLPLIFKFKFLFISLGVMPLLKYLKLKLVHK